VASERPGATEMPGFGDTLQRIGRTLAGRGAADAPRTQSPLPAGALVPGTLVGGYRIQRLIGRGAMGAVYLAVDPRNDTPVALKTLALAQEFDEADYAAARLRFLQEAATASRLQHPDIVALYGAGDDRGIAFLAMEALAGADLSRYTRPSRLLPEPVVLRIVARVAEALAYAHQQGVVHRDVKPANVMVDLPTHQVKVTDFGIARCTDAARTRTGLTIGTPAFMAPEQLAGDAPDAASDLYALGVMLFQLLTGRLPYEGDSLGRLLKAIATEPPLALHALRPSLPAELAPLMDSLLAKSARARSRDGHEVAAALLAVRFD
jgi:serine/threonine protein kinase